MLHLRRRRTLLPDLRKGELMGRPKKYHTEEERKAAKRRERERWNEKRRKGGGKSRPKSWIKNMEAKLDAAMETTGTAVSSEDQTPPDRPGEPFADLPPLDLPGTSAGSAESPETPGASQEGQEGTSSPKETPKADKADAAFINTEVMQQMAEDMIYRGTMALGVYAAERGQPALGEFWCRIAGKAAAVLVKAHAKDLNIDDETGSAYVVLGVAGVNGVQAFRAYKIEKQKEQEAKEIHAAPAKPPQHVNGAATHGEPPPEQRRPDEAKIVLRPGALV